MPCPQPRSEFSLLLSLPGNVWEGHKIRGGHLPCTSPPQWGSLTWLFLDGKSCSPWMDIYTNLHKFASCLWKLFVLQLTHNTPQDYLTMQYRERKNTNICFVLNSVSDNWWDLFLDLAARNLILAQGRERDGSVREEQNRAVSSRSRVDLEPFKADSTTTEGSCCDSSTARNSQPFPLWALIQTINSAFCQFLSSPSTSIILSSSTGHADSWEDICVYNRGY